MADGNSDRLDFETKQAAILFLSNIPLNITEACGMFRETATKRTDIVTIVQDHDVKNENPDKHSDIPTFSGDCLYNQPPSPHFVYKRSISTHAGSSIKTRPMERRSSLILIENKAVASKAFPSNENLSYKRNKIRNPIMKMKYITNKMLHKSRIFMMEPLHNTPCAVFSTLPYIKDGHKFKSQASSRRHQTSDQSHHEIIKLSESSTPPTDQVSYHQLLSPSKLEPVIDLDTSEWKSGKHRTVLNFPGYMVSIISYTKPSELKRNLNDRFSESYPSVFVTLSKIRSLERQMLRTAKQFNLQTGVLSCAKSYFERLVFSSVINKVNRHHVAAACLLLSAKIHGDLKPHELSQLITSLEHSFKTSKNSFLRLEFSVFATLNFSFVPTSSSQNSSGEL